MDHPHAACSTKGKTQSHSFLVPQSHLQTLSWVEIPRAQSSSLPQTLPKNDWPTPPLSVGGIQASGHLERRWSVYLIGSFWKAVERGSSSFCDLVRQKYGGSSTTFRRQTRSPCDWNTEGTLHKRALWGPWESYLWTLLSAVSWVPYLEEKAKSFRNWPLPKITDRT